MRDRLKSRWTGLAILAVVYFVIVYLIPKPAAVKPEGWRLTGFFIATIAGLVLQPVPAGALVLASLALVSVCGGLTIQQALAGYGDPTVWLVMAAVINGYELSAPPAASPAPSRSGTWRRWVQDFARHFLGGYRSRYAPVWTCLKLTLGAGLATLITFVIAYQAISWAGMWLWYGLTRLIGAHDLATWQVFADIISVFIGSPSDMNGGILLDAVRIALLAAVLETAVAQGSARERNAAAIQG